MILYLWTIVQIIGESLPISSSGHVILLQKIMMKYSDISYYSSQNLVAFDYFLQGVSAVIFFFYFFSTWWQLIIDKPIKLVSLWDMQIWRHKIFPVFLFGLIADGITFLLWHFHCADAIALPLVCGFFITALALWSLQFTREKKDICIWSLSSAVMVGCAQGCALLPGISRFGVTVAVFQWLGYQGRVACALSFLLQWPLILAGSLLGLYTLQGTPLLKSIMTMPFLMTILLAGYIAYKILWYMTKLIDEKSLWKISYYMIIPMIMTFLL